MTRHFARPVFAVSLHASKQNLVLLRTKYYVIAKHRFAVLWQSPGRAPYCLRQLNAYGVILSSTVILRCSDICPVGKLRIYYLYFGGKPKYNFDKVKI